MKDGLTAVASAEKRTFSGREARAAWCVEQLERGNVVLLAASAFSLPEADRAFLLGQRQSSAGYHKNIAYRPLSDRQSGCADAR